VLRRAPIRHVLASVVFLAAGLAIAHVSAARAAGATSSTHAPRTCAEAVIDDWYGDSRIDKRYPPHCYREAIATLTPDQKDYLHAEEDILRALAYAKAGKDDPGAAGALTGKPTAQVESQPKPKPPTRKPPTPSTNPHVAVDDVSADATSSIPLPLILLGGLAVTLLAAGGFGVISRRLRASRDNGTG